MGLEKDKRRLLLLKLFRLLPLLRRLLRGVLFGTCTSFRLLPEPSVDDGVLPLGTCTNFRLDPSSGVRRSPLRFDGV